MKKNDPYLTSRCSMKVFYDVANELMNNTKHTLRDVFECHAKTMIRQKNMEVFIYEENGKTKSLKYKDYYNEVMKYANTLSSELSLISKGSFVAIKLNNTIKWPLTFWGLIAAGYKPLLISPILGNEDTERLIKESNSAAIISDKDDVYSVLSLNVWKIKIEENSNYQPRWENEIAFCTSGTTGDSRIFVYDGEAITYQIYSAYDMPKTTADIMYLGKIRLLAVVPFSHIFGFVAIFLWYTYFGMTIVFPNSMNPDDLSGAIKKYKCTHIYSVPLFWDTVSKKFKQGILLQSEKKQKLVHKVSDFKNKYITATEAGFAKSKIVLGAVQKQVLGKQITFCIAGGSALSRDTLETMNGIGYNLYNGYGMTEIGITSVELSPDAVQRNRGSVGKPLHGVEYKIVDNELLVKSKYLHIARLVDGKRLEADLDNEGFFHTGDIAEIDNLGYTYIHGKKKDVIIGSNGENIYPEEIESKFKNLPFVSNLSIVGIKNDKDEVVTLFINVDKQLNEDEITKLENSIKDSNESLPVAMQVRECYIAKNDLPINSSMKIKKFELIKDFKENKENFVKLGNGVSVSFQSFDEKKVKEIMDHIIDIISSVLYIEKKNIGPNSHIINDLGGDSFSYMSILSSIESEFNIRIPSEKIGRLNSASEFTLYILKSQN